MNPRGGGCSELRLCRCTPAWAIKQDYRWELNNKITWTREGEHHTPGPIMGRGEVGGIALGVIPDVNDEMMGADELMGAAQQHGTSIHM